MKCSAKRSAAAKLHRSDANVDRRSDYRRCRNPRGLVSPSIVVVGAITAVSGVTLVNQSLSTIISILRLFFFAMGAFLGMFGIILGMIVLAAYLSRFNRSGCIYYYLKKKAFFYQECLGAISLPNSTRCCVFICDRALANS
ncbi:spore germination protein [Cohnella faecalis]|nr:spore germination protein [Cohnella faecalis]